MPSDPENSDISDETILTDGVTQASGSEQKTLPSAIYARSIHAAVTDRYEVGKEIARGGMGAVLEAQDPALDRTVAMKVLLSSDASVAARLRFVREAAVLARLEHPNIVPIHELNTDENGQLYYTMKKVEGRTLQAVITDLKKGDAATIREWPLDRLLSAFHRICDAIGFAHSRGVIHRDLKPENVMVGSFGEVLVMDWGLAKLSTDDGSLTELPAGIRDNAAMNAGPNANLTQEGTVMGSPQYMSPEQAAGHIDEIDAKSDIFSLGGILYVILTLAPPFSGTTVTEVLAQVRSGQIVPPSRVKAALGGRDPVPTTRTSIGLPHCPGGRIPAALSAVTMRAMATEKTDRYCDVGDLSADIAAYRHGYATSVENLGPWGLLRLWTGRNRGITATAAVLVAFISWLWFDFTLDLQTEKSSAVSAAADAQLARTEADAARSTAETERETSRRALAQARITIADQARARKDWAAALEELNTVPEDLRKAKWQRVQRGSDNSIKPPIPLPQYARSVEAHPKKPGVFLYSNSEISLLDVVTGKRSVLLNRAKIRTTAMSPSGRYLALLPEATDGSLEIVDLDSGVTVSSIERPSSVYTIQFDKTDEILFWAGAKKMIAFDWKLGTTIWKRTKLNGAKLLNSRGHPLIVAADDIMLIDPATGSSLRRWPCSDKIRKMDLDATGTRLVYWNGQDQLGAIDLETGREIFAVDCGNEPRFNVHYLPDGRHFVNGVKIHGTQPGYSVEVRQSGSGRLVQVLSGGLSNTANLDVHPLTGHILTRGYCRLWQPKISPPMVSIPSRPSPTQRLSLQANTWGFVDEHRLVISPIASGSLACIDLATGDIDEDLFPPSGNGSVASLFDMTPDRQRMVVAQPKPNGSKLRFVLSKPLSAVPEDEELLIGEKLDPKTDVLRISPDGRRLLYADYLQSKIIATDTGELLAKIDRKGKGNIFRLLSADWVGDGSRLLALAVNGKPTGQIKMKNQILLWHGVTGELLTSTDYPTQLRTLAVSPGGKRFAETGTDLAIRFRDVETLQIEHEIHGHDAEVTALAWHPAQNVLASASGDLSVRLWNTDTGKLLATIHGFGATPIGLRFSPSGDQIAAITESPENMIRVWKTPTILQKTD